MDAPSIKRRAVEEHPYSPRIHRPVTDLHTRSEHDALRPVTCDSDYVINGQERWGIARSPRVKPPKPNELSALSERIIGFHTHSFAYAAACAWIEQDTRIFGPDVVAKLVYEIFIPVRI